ncbi:MAG: NTP transferase domain-containing protein, partial [Planctomycetes bacterium]|nr:NTP transferase domain-containing protein [Planctomycetota bacterium]
MRPISVLPMILAGGIGERLYPLTSNRAKPAVPFGGSFRVIDFTLMSCVCSGFRNIHVLTQYHTQSLNQHAKSRWSFLASELGEQVEIVPPKMRAAGNVYLGTADAIYRNLDLLDRTRPDVVLVLSGDHVYRADYQRFVETHVEREADVTVLTGRVDPPETSAFGVVNIAPDGVRIARFVEKPADPTPYAVDGRCLINLGVYCFQTTFLVERLVADAKRKTAHDFGRNILPDAIHR